MKLFGHPLSSCTRKVLVTLSEKGATADFTLVDLFVAEHKAQQHLSRQPFGVIPVLDDDGFVLYESRAIIRYPRRQARRRRRSRRVLPEIARGWTSGSASISRTSRRTRALSPSSAS